MSKLQDAHYELIGKYIDLLNEVSMLPPSLPKVHSGIIFENPRIRSFFEGDRKTKKQKDRPSKDITSLRFLVRLFVESHIRGKLTELSVAYSYLAQKVQADKQFVTWLKEISEECDKLAGSLTSWLSFRGILSIWWPVIVGLLTARQGKDDIYAAITAIKFNVSTFTSTYIILAFPLMWFSIFIGSSFEYKRALFLPGLDRFEKPKNPDQYPTQNQIVYYLEDQVFNLTGRGKVREIPLDIIGRTAGFITLAIYFLLPPWGESYLGLIGAILSPFLGAIFLLGALTYYILYTKRRKWN